jgi:thymidylate synthase ThyX
VRCDRHTQKEHRIIAEEIRGIFGKCFPVTAAALQEVAK